MLKKFSYPLKKKTSFYFPSACRNRNAASAWSSRFFTMVMCCWFFFSAVLTHCALFNWSRNNESDLTPIRCAVFAVRVSLKVIRYRKSCALSLRNLFRAWEVAIRLSQWLRARSLWTISSVCLSVRPHTWFLHNSNRGCIPICAKSVSVAVEVI